jgi:carnitine 3-dehydrogenase
MDGSDNIRRVAVIGAGTIGASRTVLFPAHGLTVAASDAAPEAETFSPKVCCRGLAESLPTLFIAQRATLGGAEFPCRAGGGPAGADFVKENAPERGDGARLAGPARSRCRPRKRGYTCAFPLALR